MQLGQSFLKEIRTVRYLVYILVSLALINEGVVTVRHWNEGEAISIVALLVVLGYNLFYLVLVWQLGRRREWARKILLGLVYLGSGVVGLGFIVLIVRLLLSKEVILQLALVGPIQGNLLSKIDYFKIYNYGLGIIYGLINGFLNFLLTKSVVRDACQVRRSRTSASGISQNAR